MPPIRNYPPKEYAAAPQIWCAVRDHRGLLYFGTGQAILEYDGKTWRQLPVKPGAIVYSLATDSTGRIYVGTAGDFGYLSDKSLVVSGKSLEVSHKSLVVSRKSQSELDSLKVAEDTLPKGTLRYVSLLPLVPEKERNFGNVWKTHSCRAGTFFNALTHLFFYDGKSITVIKPEEWLGADTAGTKPQNRRFFRSFLIDDTVYIEHRAMGIFQYTGKKWLPLAGSKEFVTYTKGIYSLLSANNRKSEFFVITKRDGLWHYSPWAKPEFAQFLTEPRSAGNRIGKIVNSNWDVYTPQCQPYGGILLKTMGDETIADVSIAINTSYGGCYIFSPLVQNDEAGASLVLQHHFNRESGTSDNTILNILSTDNGVMPHNTSLLWLCNDIGISKVTYPSPLSYYDYKEGIEGMIHSSITWKNRLWLATSQGVYYSFNPGIPQERVKTDKGLFFERLPGIDEQCFNIISYRKTGAVKQEKEEVLIIATILGLCEVSVSAGGEIKAKQLSKVRSIGLTAEALPGGRIFSGSDGLYATWQTKAGWITSALLTEKEVKGITSILLSKKQATAGNKGEEEPELWLGTRYQGLLRVVVTPDNKVKEKEWYREEDGLPEGEISTFSCTGAAGSKGVLVGTNKGLWEVVSSKSKVVSEEDADEQINSDETQILNPKSPIPNPNSQILNSQLIPCSRYGEMFTGKLKGDSGSYLQVFRFVEEENGDVWMTTDEREYHLRKIYDNIYKIDSIPFLNIKDKTGPIYTIHPSGGGITFFGGAEGLAMYDAKVKKDYKPVYYTLVRRVMVGKDSVIFNGTSPSLTVEGGWIEYHLNNLTFEFSAPFFEDEEKTQYIYMLEGYDKDWSVPVREHKVRYTNLPEGKYQFRVKAKNIYSHESKFGEYRFEILPPWNRTWWAYTLFATTSLFILYGLFRWRVALLQKEKKILEETVKIRTAQVFDEKQKVEIEKQKVELAYTQLKDLELFKESMMGMIVHDLKNPLSIIIGYSDEQKQKPLNVINQAGKNMLNLISDILDVQKFEQTEVKLKYSDCDLNNLAENAIANISFLSAQKNISVKNKIPHSMIAEIDAELICRVFINLLTNSVKFTPTGGIIVIDAEPRIKDDDYYFRISVTDTGEGIPKEKINSVFDKFSQAEARKSGAARSTGLGLTFCKLAVEAHTGAIWVESEPEKGTAFYFTLPKAEGAYPIAMTEKPALEDTEEIAFSGESKLSFSTKKILLPFSLRLRKIPVNRAGDIIKILNEISDDDKHIRHWKETLQETVFNFNDKKYYALLDDVVQESHAEEPVIQPVGRFSKTKPVILVVDDEIHIRDLIRQYLEEAGCKIDVAYNGKDAVEKTNKKGYNIILMDNNMPVMSGIEATRQIRTMKQIQQPKIISISSDSDEKTVQAIQQSGINAHLLKPITKDKLLDAIASLLATN